MPRSELFAMKSSFYLWILGVVFHALINAPLLGGLVIYGQDTGAFDVPFRFLSSALLVMDDYPFWYPNAGDGFPQFSLEYITLTWNPLGALLGHLRPYDFLSLAIENVIWRIIGFAAAYALARIWGVAPTGATAVAATYIGSGLMASAALAYATLIGQMLAPWILVGGSIAIRARTTSGVVQGGAVMGLGAAAMVWTGYAGTWVSAPVVSGPLLVALAVASRRGIWRVASASLLGLFLAMTMTGLLISETLQDYTSLKSTIFRSEEIDMTVGSLKSIDFVGFFLVNPSYITKVLGANIEIRDVYIGVAPVFSLFATTGTTRRIPGVLFYILILISSLYLSNFTTLSLFDHVQFSNLSDVDNRLYSPFDFTIILHLFIPLALTSFMFGLNISLTMFEKIAILVCIYITLISSDNFVANILRQHVPPYSLVRHNALYLWVILLTFAIISVRRFDYLSHLLLSSPGNYLKSRVAGAAASVVLIAALIGMSNIGRSDNSDISRIGIPYLAWQSATVLFITITLSLFLYFRNILLRYNSRTLSLTCFLGIVSLCFVTALLAALQTNNIWGFASVNFTYYELFLIDLVHLFIMIFSIVFILFQRLQLLFSRMLYLLVIIADLSVAVPRYFYDSGNIGVPYSGWPFSFSALSDGKAEALFAPDQGDGSRKTNFWQPFTGSLRPPPSVTGLQASWGDAYDQWVHFPSHWLQDQTGRHIVVPRDAIGPQVDFPRQSRLPTWGVVAATTGGRSSPAARLQQSPQVETNALNGLVRHDACSGSERDEHVSLSGKVLRLQATKVMVLVQSDCERLLVFTDSWAPGWSARIDGQPAPVLRVNDAVRGVIVGAGEHSLEWRYRPRYLHVWLFLLAGGLATAGLLVFAPWLAPRLGMQAPDWVGWAFSVDAHFTPSQVGGIHLVPSSFAIPTVINRTHSRDTLNVPIERQWRSRGIRSVLISLIIAVVLIPLVMYAPEFDGPARSFQLFVVRSIVAGGWAWIVVAGRSGFRSPVGPVIMLLVLIPPLAFQVARRTYPISSGIPISSPKYTVDDDTWLTEWKDSGLVHPTDTGQASWLTLRKDGILAESISRDLPQLTRNLWPWWQRPLGEITAGVDVSWTATINRTGPYYTILTMGRLNIQAVHGGILVTAPAPSGDMKADFVTVDLSPVNPTRFGLSVHPDASSLSIDARAAWKAGSFALGERVTLGDASTDREHAGLMFVTRAKVVQRVHVRAT